ncbi:SRPBCC family protein [Cupriavidus pauculus]|uniref:SRPBCC family protein n=1 Tax=Cupriavidus pauculus TaxID=82633 RepID=UPI001EE330E0|nr:SRPBCC family protein [Cupriavidus pauculus]GJG98458.1 SRPBCC family protein [Cupriavidus pauculus]
MAQASANITLPVSPDRVWQLIGGFDSLPDWLPYIPKSELSEGGRVRRLLNPDGDAIVERLEAFDNAGRSYTYSILEAPFPVTGYRSTLRVVGVAGADGNLASRVEWSGQFTPAGVSDEDASQLFAGIYRDGLQALQATLTGAAAQ